MSHSLIGTRAAAAAFLLSALAALALGSVTPAFGHNVVEQRIPAPDSEVSQSPVEVSIATDGSFLDLGGEGRGFAIVVRDSSGQYFGDGCVELTEGRMKASIELGEPGVYELAYQFVSADGHSLAESYEFTYAPADDYRSAPGYPSPPECGVKPGPAEASTEVIVDAVAPVAEQSASMAEANSNGWVVGAGIVATVAALALLVMIRRSSRSANRQ